MENEQSTATLQALKSKILDDLGGMTDQLVGNDIIGFDALFAIARNTGNVELLGKALEKCEAITDQSDKADALLELLGEVEMRLATDDIPAELPEDATSEEFAN